MPNFFNELENNVKNQNQIQDNSNDFWKQQQETQDKIEATRLENRQRYGVDISDEEYACYNELIANSKNPDEEAHKIGTAILFSKNLGITRDEAYANLEQFKKAYWDDTATTSYRKWYTAAADSFKMGANNVRIGMIGMQLMSAQKDGNTEQEKALLEEYKALNADNETRYDNAPRTWATNCLKDGMQSLPYSMAAGGAAMFGSFILPGVGTAMSFGLSSTLMAGQEYIDALNAGVRPEIARQKALISGALQGAVEAALDPIVGATGGTIGKVTGKAVFTKPAEQLIEKLTTSLQRKFHFGKAGKIALNSLFTYLKSLPSEGAEEFIQQEIGENFQNKLYSMENAARAEDRSAMLQLTVNEIGDAVKEDLQKVIEAEYPDLEIKSQKQILDDSIEAFKGGIRGAIVLGIIPGAAKGIATEVDYLTVKKLASTIDSEKMFNDVVEKSKAGQNVKEEFNAKQQETLWHDIWTDAQKEKDLTLKNKAKEVAEVNPANEGYEEIETDEETGELIAKAPYRKENGELDTQDIKTGANTYSFRAGDSTKKDKNLYGNIEYTKDTENKTITINSFEMSEQREGLRNELYDSFAKTNAGYEIKWDNVIGERAKEARQALIDANPRGSANGLNYYEDAIAIKNAAATKEVTGKIKSIFESHNKTISDEELSHFAALTQMAYNSLADKQLQDLNAAGINNYADFMETIRWGNEQDLESELNSRGSQIDLTKVQGMTIQANMQEIAKGAKAIIYVGQNGDFSTLVHEFTHFLRGVYTDEAIADVAEAIGVKKENGKYNWTTEDEEKLAYNFEQYLNGNFTPETTGVKNFFDNLAKFMSGAIAHMKNFIQLTPQIIEAYDSLLKADNSVLKAAEEAVQEMEKGRREKEIADQQRKDFEERQQKANEEKITKNKTKENKTTQAEEQAIKDDFPLNAEEKAAAETTVQQEERIIEDAKNTMIGSSLSANEQEAIANVITNPDVSMEEKQDLATDLAENAKKEQEGLYQLINMESVEEAARRGYATSILVNAQIFEKLNKKGSYFRKSHKDYEERQIQEELKRKTGWEIIAGKPRYELDDGFNHLVGTTSFYKLLDNAPSELCFLADGKRLIVSDYVEAAELYKYFPLLEKARLQFFIDVTSNAPTSEITDEGISVNLASVDQSSKDKAMNGIMGILTRSFQNFIFATEYAREDKYKNTGYADIYKDIQKKASRLNIDKSYTEEATLKSKELSRNAFQLLSILAAKRLQKSTSEKEKTSFTSVSQTKEVINKKVYGQRMLMQVIGEMGATALDAAEETTIRMENNQIAKQMEEAGKDPKAIRLATGWERGPDGLWKYEIADFKLKENPKWELVENDNGDYHKGKLIDLIDASELFKAYPEFKNYDVHTSLYGKSLGEYSRSLKMISLSNNYEKTINKERQDKINELQNTVEYKAYDTARNELIKREINTEEEYDAWEKEIDALDQRFNETEIGKQIIEVTKNPRYIEILNPEVLNTLVHEVQHAIQDIEGFATGGDEEIATKYANKAKDAFNIVAFYKEIKGKYNNDKEKYNYNQIALLEDIKKEYREADCEDWLPSEDVMTKAFNYFVRGYGIEEEEKIVKDNHLDKRIPHVSKDGYTNYKRLAGEVEARNAETRMNLSLDDRLNTLLSETMDVAPEDQIVFFEAARMAKEELSNEAAEEELKHDPLYGQRMLMQVIGEMGATALDAAEETTIRMENNQIAKQMEEAGKDPKAIRLATGWERGPDGLWKYEIADDYKLRNNRTTNYKTRNYENNIKQFEKELKALTNLTEEEKAKKERMIAAAVKAGAMEEGTTLESMIQEKQAQINFAKMVLKEDTSLDQDFSIKNLIENGDESYDFWNVGINEHTLESIIDNSKLFTAYPQLKDYTIKFLSKNNGMNKGSFSSEEKVFLIYPMGATNFKEFKNTLVHEVQHAIQDIEGFATGGSISQIEANKKFYQDQISEIEKDIFILENDIPENDKINFYAAGGNETEEEFTERQKKFYENYSNGSSILSLIKNKNYYQNKLNDLTKKDNFDLYKSIAGEVEARNVQTRMNLSLEDRLNSLLTETMDIAPEDQIVFFETARMAKEELSNEAAEEELKHDPLFQKVTDPEELKWLNNQETVKAYRTMQLQDGKLYPPMAGKVKNNETGKTEWQKPLDLNKWERSEERPDLVDDNGNFTLNKGNGKSIKAAYAPYFHSSQSMLNDQFKEAQDRPELVVVEVEVPVSELNGINPYTAPKAKKSVGPHEWPAGVLRNQMEGKRYVNLSRWDKVIRVVPNEEVVASIDKMFKDNGFNKDIPLPTNVFTPQVKEGLEKAGWKFIKTDNHDKVLEGEKAGLTYTKAYAKKEGLFQELDDQTLYGVHNISEAGLKHAFDMGGLANPSMAVVDKNIQSLEGFGEISLIALASTINKSTGGNAGTYGADIYSPRYPGIKTFVTDYGRKDIEKIFSKVTEKYPELSKELIYGLIDRIESSSRSITGEDLLYTNLPIVYLLEKNNEEVIQTTKPKFSQELIDRYKVIENKNLESPELQQLYKDYMLDYWLSRAVKDPEYTTNKEEVVKDFTKIAEEDLQNSLDDNGLVAGRYIYPFQDQLERDLNYSGKIDRYQTESKAKDIIRNNEDLKKDFLVWAENKMAEIEKEEKIFNGFTPSGNRRYLSHTLENVSKYMKQQGLKGGENFSYGMNSTKALLAPKWTTLAQIRKNKDRLATSEQVEKAREELKDYYNELTDKLRNGLSDFDAGEARLQEAYSTPGVDPLTYLEDEYGITFTEDEAEDFKVFTEALKNLPTKYFETKWEKPIYTENFGSTFAAAVVPNTIDPKLKEKLEKNYLYVFEYNPSEEGSKAAVTKQAVESVSTKRKVLFQTQDELYEDARRFDTWQEFMDDYTMGFDPRSLEDPDYHNQIPSDADAQFYQSVWEMAHAMQTEESMNAEEVRQQQETETSEAAALDAYFVTKVTSDPDMLDNFLKRAAEIDSINFGSDEYVNPADEEEELQWQKLEAMQDFIKTQLSHGSWISNGKRLLNGKEITDSQRNRILSLIKAAPRDYRAIYAEIMEDDNLKVEAKDSVAAKLEKNARKYKLVNPNEDIERMSPEKRRQLADLINDAQVKEKIRNGSMKLNDEVTSYIKSLEKKAKEAKKEVEDLEAAQKADYKTIADWETRRLLELNEKLLIAKAAYEKSNDKVTREIAKGIKISGKYQKQVQNLKANYDEIFRKFEDLRSVITINAFVQEMLDRQVKIKKAKGNLGKIEDEAEVMRQVKAIRIQLVKRTMRRVPFDRIAYDEAKAIIAIQRMLEPNLLGGVNRWISTEGAILRNVISGILTDDEYRADIMEYVKKNQKASEANLNFIKKLRELKTIEDYEKWDEKTKKYAIKHLPKEDWVRDLNLKQLAKEREESIDLDVGMKEKRTPMTDENGEIVYMPFYEKDGITIVKNPKDPSRQLRDDNGQVMADESGATLYMPVYDNNGNEVDPDIKRPYELVTFELDAKDDIRQLVKDNVGADLYEAIINRPFADWSTEDLEKLAIKINKLYTEGRDKLAATKQLRREGQRELRDLIEKAAKNTGITINADDPEDVKKKKQEKINKILGIDNALKGTKNVKKETKLNRFLHGYADANVRRVARILDNYSEGTNTDLLYWREDECYNNKQRTIKSRVENINKVLEENKINLNDLYKEVEVDGRKFTVDELLFFLAADEDFINDPKLEEKGFVGLDANDDYAATSRNAVMFGNMLSDTESLEIKQELDKEDQKMIERIESGNLSTEEKNLLTLGNLVRKPGTYKYIEKCKQRYEKVLAAARQVENSNEGYEALRKAIAEDYAAQYDRMNEVSIAEYNTPVHRVKCYVPMYRLESNGDTNENQVRADLLATMGSDSTRSWVNKGMTKRRTEISPLHQKPVQTGLYKTWTDSTEKTEHFIAYSGYVRDLNAIYKSRDASYLRQYIENRFGKGMINYIDDYIAEIANPNANKVRKAADEIVRTLRGKTAPAYLSWKASSILKQAMTSPWPYMQFVDPATYVAACFKCMQPGTMDAIKNKSIFMSQRRFDPMADLTDEMADKARNKFDNFMAKTSQIGMAGLEMVDWVCVAPGWLACYEKEYARLQKGNDARYQAIKRQLEEDRAYYQGGENYMSDEEITKLAEQTLNDAIEYDAIRYADDCVRLCQPSNRNVDISPLFKNSSEAWKAYLQFQTSLNVIWQNIRYDLPYAVKQKQFKQIVGMILGYTFAGIAMNFLMEGAGNDADDDDKEKQIAKDILYYSTTQFTDAIPLIGSAVTQANQKIITGRSGYTTSGTDMTPMLTKFIKVGENAVKGATYSNSGDDDKAREAWIKACTNFGEGVGMYLGLPTQGVKEVLKIAGVGDNDGKAGVHLENVYGSLDPVAKKVYGED